MISNTGNIASCHLNQFKWFDYFVYFCQVGPLSQCDRTSWNYKFDDLIYIYCIVLLEQLRDKMIK